MLIHDDVSNETGFLTESVADFAVDASAGPSDRTARDAAIARFLAAARKRSIANAVRASLVFPTTVAIAILAGVPLRRWDPVYGGGYASTILGGSVIAGVVLSACCLFPDMSAAFSGEVAELVRGAGVDAIGTLIDMDQRALQFAQLHEVYDAIALLLPALDLHNCQRLTHRHRDFLDDLAVRYRLGVSVKRHTQLRIAAIGAIARTGDARSLGVLRRVARASALRTRPTVVQQAALQAIPLLEMRLAEAQSHRTLLRASTSASAEPESLLRAAASAAAGDAEQMLRAAEEQT